ncbi:MAG: hypothetical protein KIT10_14325 [Flavobacteriales bacterium]|nr:hypothetical protein [Flavobacteriales bacterium]
MRSLAVVSLLAMSLVGHGQDSTRARPQLLLEAGWGRTWFTASGDDYQYFDTYWQEGEALSGGLLLRAPISRTFALRIGARVFSREFGSLTFDYRTPINSQQSGYSPNRQFTRMAMLGVPMAVEYMPIRWVSLSAGMQVLKVLDQTSNPWGDNHSAPVKVAAMEWMGQLDLWPVRRVGLSLRYLHQAAPMREQSIWTPDRVYRRTTHWRTVEAGLIFVLVGAQGGGDTSH